MMDGSGSSSLSAAGNGEVITNRRRTMSSPLLFRSRLSPTLADAFSVTAVRSQFAAFLSFRGFASLLRFWLEADTTMRSAVSPSSTTSAAAREMADRCGVTTILSNSDFEKGVAHCQWTVAHELETKYFEDFKSSSFFANYQLELLNATVVAANVEEQMSEKLSLDDIVFCETSLFHFREFIEQQQSSTFATAADVLLAMLNFYIAAASFCREYSSETALSDALGLYDKYLSLQAVRPVGLPDSIRRQVEEGIAHESGRPEPNTFDPALSSVRKLLAGEGILGQFFHSDQFQELVQDVKRRAASTNDRRNSSCPNFLLTPAPTEDDAASTTSTGSNTNISGQVSVQSTSSRSSSAIRRVASLRLARIDDVTGAYISEFNSPNLFLQDGQLASPDGSDMRSSPVPGSGNSTTPSSTSKIKRIFSLRSTNTATTLQRQEIEAERRAAEIIGEISAIIASSSPTPTPRSSMAFDQ